MSSSTSTTKPSENQYGTTKRIMSLHNKMADKPEIAADMDKYIQEQVINRNYVEIDILEVRKNNHQLHFVRYSFIVSATRASTKVRMTTDSSMRTKSGLSLNEVTQPAPGDIRSLQGILVRFRSRTTRHFFGQYASQTRTPSKDCLFPIQLLLLPTYSQPYLDLL